ncbi:MAG: electron transfer flavoprotein subunit beta/FixA family protein [Candidatus Sericytochromatia bacterium]
MNIVVCVKQVPEVQNVGLDRTTGYARRDQAKGVVNLADRHALELGLALKAAAGGNLIALCMGPAGADQALRQALAVGFDEAYLVTDAALAGSDTAVTTRVLAEAIRKLPDVGLVLTGELSIDGATAQIAPRLAEALGWPVVTSVYEASLEGGTLKAGRNGEGRREQVEATGALVLSVSLDSPKPRIPNAMGVMKAAKKPLTTWGLADLGLDAATVGQEGSCTWVTRTFKPEKREKGETLQGDANELAKSLLERLARKNLVQV